MPDLRHARSTSQTRLGSPPTRRSVVLVALGTSATLILTPAGPALAAPDDPDAQRGAEIEQLQRERQERAKAGGDQQGTLDQPLAAEAKEWPDPTGALPHPENPLNKDALPTLAVNSVTPTADGALFDLGGFIGQIRLFTDDLAKVSVRAKGKEEYFSPGIAKRDWAPVEFTVEDSATTYRIVTADLTVEVLKERFGVRMLDAAGNVINEDDMRYGSGYENGKPYVVKKTDAEEDFYGFGEQTRGLNKRGESMRMWNTDNYRFPVTAPYVYATIPFFYGLKGDDHAYGIFFDNTHRSYYEMASEADDYYYFYADGGDLTYYFFNGPSIADILTRYTELTGRQPLPAEWTLGWQQSKWGYKPGQKLVEVAQEYRNRKIPLDAMNFDIDYMDGWRVFTWNEEDFPPEELDAQLEALGVKTVTINDPGVKVDDNYDVYLQGNELDAWVTGPNFTDYIGDVWAGSSKFPDFTRQDVRDWWGGLHGNLLDRGVEGQWLDMNEPAVFSEPYHTAPIDVEFNHGTLQHTEVHNLYGFHNTQAAVQGFNQFKPGQRPFILTRDTYAGGQRYAALWTGDNESSWEHLAMTIPQNSNVGISGVAQVGNDIGGFAGTATPELMARWMQVGAFIPFSRVHYDNTFQEDQPGQEPWAFGPQVEAIGKRYIELRYKLLPYLYNAYRAAELSGEPVQQPLIYQFQDDEKVRDIDDQYMFGENLMVAPVVTQGQRSRSVYLPAGSRWTDWWTGSTFAGGQTITRVAPLGTMPLYVRSDSIVPMREVQQHTGEKPLTDLEVHAWVDGSASTVFYEDDGWTHDKNQGEYDETRFTATRSSGGSVRLQQEVVHDGYDSAITTVTLKVHDVPRPLAAAVVGKVTQPRPGVMRPDGGITAETLPVSYDADKRVATVTIPATTTEPVTLQFSGRSGALR